MRGELLKKQGTSWGNVAVKFSGVLDRNSKQQALAPPHDHALRHVKPHTTARGVVQGSTLKHMPVTTNTPPPATTVADGLQDMEAKYVLKEKKQKEKEEEALEVAQYSQSHALSTTHATGEELIARRITGPRAPTAGSYPFRAKA